MNKTNIWVLMIALLSACTAFQLNASMLGPVLVTIGKELSADEAAVALTQTAFYTSAALFSLFLPRLSDLKGRRLVLGLMLLVMTLGNILSALAPNVEILFLSRIIQGVSGPVISMSCIMLRNEVTDPKRCIFLMSVVAAVNGGIAGIDAIAGGFIAANYGFRAVFWTIAVVGAIATLLVFKCTPESKPNANLKMDWLGVFLIVLSLALMLNAINKATMNLTDNIKEVIICVLVSLMVFYAFVWVEKRKKDPLVSVSHLKKRETWAILLTTTLTLMGIFAVANGLAMSIAQNADIGFGLSADKAALYLLTPYALIGWLVGPFAGRLAANFGYNIILKFGLLGSVIGLGIIQFIGLESLWSLIFGMIFLGITYAGCVNIMLSGLGIVLSPKDNAGFLPGMNAGSFNLGAGLSFAILPAIVSSFGETLQAYKYGVMAGLFITILALLTSYLIPKPKDF